MASYLTEDLVTTIGLLLDIAGVALLFKYGLPPDVNRHGLIFPGIANDDSIKEGKRYERWSYAGLVALILGFALQAAAVWLD